MDKKHEYMKTVGGIAIGQVGFPETEPTKQTPLRRLEWAREALHKATAHLAEITDQLCGPEPSNAAGGNLNAVPCGVFGAIEQASDDINVLTARISEYVGRISRQIA